MGSHSERNPVELFIPTPADGGQRAFTWRLAMIAQHKPCSIKLLMSQFKLAQEQRLSPQARQELVRAAKSDQLCLDEVEMTILWVAGRLLEVPKMTDKQLLLLDRRARFVVESGKGDHADYIKSIRKNLRHHGEMMLATDVPKIRAKLAFQEIVALVAPDDMIPFMVSLSPRYLSSVAVQLWIRIQQLNKRSQDAGKRSQATKNLGALSKSITGDGRKAKVRHYPYWHTALTYERIFSHIKEFRRQRKEGDFDGDYFDAFCAVEKIPKLQKTALLDPTHAAAELALEILVNRKAIEDPKSFREFQARLNKLQKKHFGMKILGIARELDPILFDFMDLPSRHPEALMARDPFDILEKVSLTPSKFRPNS